MAQAFAVTVVADEAGKRRDIFLRAVDFEIEIGFDLKRLAEIRIGGRQAFDTTIGSPIMITLVSVGIGSGRSPWGGTKPKNALGSSILSSRFLITRCSASQTPALDNTSRS